MDNLFLRAHACLLESDIENKLALTRALSERLVNDDIAIAPQEVTTTVPGRPDRPNLIAPQHLPRRKLGTTEGRAAMIHSFAHIEFNAINLAWDIICRFQTMPTTFYQDWARVAREEAYHFELLQGRLQQLGYHYGDFDAHGGLWQMAEDTAHDVLLRLAVVPRILEARGLDVTPDLINRFHEIGDEKTVSILKIIYRDEIGHVKIGSDWFHFVCHQRGQDPEYTFRKIFRDFAPRGSGRLNQEARMQAGFSQSELDTMQTN